MLFYFTIKIIVNFLYLINVLIFWKKLYHPILLVKTCTGKLLRWYWHVKVKWLKILEVIYNQEYPFFSNHSITLRKVNFFIRLRLFLLKPYVSIDFFHKFFSWMMSLHLFVKHCLNCLFMADCTKTYSSEFCSSYCKV